MMDDDVSVPTPVRICTNHGLPFTNDPVGFPLHVKTNGCMVMSHLGFCRLECVKTYLVDHHPNLLDLFYVYSKEKHGVSHVRTLPSPTCLSHFHYQPGGGISVEEYFSDEVMMHGTTCVTKNNEFGSTISQVVSEDCPLQIDRWPQIYAEHKTAEFDGNLELSQTVFKLDEAAQKGLIDVDGFSITDVPRKGKEKAPDVPEAKVTDFHIG